jgi:GT2 family glycosyltransferase
MARVDVLLPTCDRLQSLIMTLAGTAAQTLSDLNLVIADQSARPVTDDPVVKSLLRVVEARGGSVESYHRVPSKGIAEQRDFLLNASSSDFLLYLDDDVFMESWVLERMLDVIREEHCGFVGAFPSGLSFSDDLRPEQELVEFWDGPVVPEKVSPDTPAWDRWHLHRAANMLHAASKLDPGEVRRYKVAWLSCCCLYDRQKLNAVGGFSFWSRLPRYHSGEEVLVQNLLMRRWGGCGLLPSGTYHSELPSTVLNADGRVDGHALELLPEMVARYGQPRPDDS